MSDDSWQISNDSWWMNDDSWQLLVSFFSGSSIGAGVLLVAKRCGELYREVGAIMVKLP